jgi:hypothetical protein
VANTFAQDDTLSKATMGLSTGLATFGALSTLGIIGSTAAVTTGTVLTGAAATAAVAAGTATVTSGGVVVGGLMTAGLTTGLVTGGVGLAIAAGVGIAAGMFGGKKSDPDKGLRESRALQAADLARQRFEEDLRQQSIRNITSRERDLAAQFVKQGRSPSPETQARLEKFRVKPTFASRLGLVDAVERELGSALKPRW